MASASLGRLLLIAAAVIAAAGCANPNAKLARENRDFDCHDRSASYTVVGSLAAAEVGVQLDCAVAGPRIMRWTVDKDGNRDERQASLGVHEFDRIWERINASGWRNMQDCTGSGQPRDPVYDISVKDWQHDNTFACVNDGPLPFPYNTIVDELDLRAAAIGGPEPREGSDD